MTEADRFATGVDGISGQWPSPPNAWSFSSLQEAESCPRRWALRRATYIGVWDRSGYPPKPSTPALVGDVMHRTFETLVTAFANAGCHALASECAVDVLRSLGGYSAVIERSIEQTLGQYEGNPRAVDRLESLRADLKNRVPEMRTRIQDVVARTTRATTPDPIPPITGGATGPISKRQPLSVGSHPEVELRAPEFRLAGRADLIRVKGDGCAIVDYKTGAPSPLHIDQIRMYAVLWAYDADLNPRQLPATELSLVYTDSTVQVEPPTLAETAELAAALRDRTETVESQVAVDLPMARPGVDLCGWCSVRHLCSEYWPFLEALPAGSRQELSPAPFGDCAVLIVARHGPKSWDIDVTSHGRNGLLRTPSDSTVFRPGDRLRILDAVLSDAEEDNRAIVSLTQTSEWWLLDPTN